MINTIIEAKQQIKQIFFFDSSNTINVKTHTLIKFEETKFLETMLRYNIITTWDYIIPYDFDACI
jgi:hypothetical protein